MELVLPGLPDTRVTFMLSRCTAIFHSGLGQPDLETLSYNAMAQIVNIQTMLSSDLHHAANETWPCAPMINFLIQCFFFYSTAN